MSGLITILLFVGGIVFVNMAVDTWLTKRYLRDEIKQQENRFKDVSNRLERIENELQILRTNVETPRE